MGRAHSLLKRAHYPLVGVLGIWLALLGLLTIPAVQREFIFLYRVRVPVPSAHARPEVHGLAPFKTRNLNVSTPDGETLGAWHVLPQSVYRSAEPFPPRSSLPDGTFDRAFASRPTVLYFHGNAATRAAHHRVRGYMAFSNILDCNVLAIDYRGFADSTGTPSETGLRIDARTAWEYARSRGASAGDIVLVGQSLGTGVASALAGELAREGVAPRAIVLIAPFASVPELLREYKLFLFIPLLSPLKHLPRLQDWLLSFVVHRFDSLTSLQNTTSPTLLVHAQNDHTIPYPHSARLFRALAHDHPSEKVDYPGWGTVSTAQRAGEGKGEVVYWDGINGGHGDLGWAEGTVDLIAKVARLP